MPAPTASPLLSEAMLQRFRERSPGYDRDNRFFQEDFDDLRQAGYLAIAAPRELGGGVSPSRNACASSAGSATTRMPPRWR